MKRGCLRLDHPNDVVALDVNYNLSSSIMFTARAWRSRQLRDDEILRHRLISALLLVAPAAWAADNPMWRSGFTWSCTFSSVIRCERASDCMSSGQGGNIKVAYRENQWVDPEGKTHSIRRHYVQTVVGSPIGSEVKIELDTNEVIWLSPADPAGTFSDNWIGAMLSPKAGVIVQELRPLICSPVK